MMKKIYIHTYKEKINFKTERVMLTFNVKKRMLTRKKKAIFLFYLNANNPFEGKKIISSHCINPS